MPTLSKFLFVAASAFASGAEYSSSSGDSGSSGSTCYDIKAAYQGSSCCGDDLQKVTDYVISPPPPTPFTQLSGENPCAGTQPAPGSYFDNTDCLVEGVVAVLEQSGSNITEGYVGGLETGDREPITDPYWKSGLCPVNVHWHLGTEHLSVGEFDEYGSGPTSRRRSRKLAAGQEIRKGFQCHHYDSSEEKFTKPYDWKYCTDMVVGETYEVHWPHSAAGACGTPNQYQSPFYDGVFCTPDILSLDPLNTYYKIGVQGQVFTIVNDEDYYYPDLIRGMIVDGEMGKYVTKYTGSTTGTSRSNEICSTYTPITWQVDRKCHLISASSFDKMCMDMLTQRDDMSSDVYPHGSRELVADHLAADNHQRKLANQHQRHNRK